MGLKLVSVIAIMIIGTATALAYDCNNQAWFSALYKISCTLNFCINPTNQLYNGLWWATQYNLWIKVSMMVMCCIFLFKIISWKNMTTSDLWYSNATLTTVVIFWEQRFSWREAYFWIIYWNALKISWYAWGSTVEDLCRGSVQEKWVLGREFYANLSIVYFSDTSTWLSKFRVKWRTLGKSKIIISLASQIQT